MKNCRNIEIELSAYVDGELSEARRAEVDTHVAGCPDCRQRAAELRRLSAGVAAMPQLPAPPQFLADVRRKIRAGEQPVTSWVDAVFRPVWPKVPLEALAIVLVVTGVFLLVRPVQRQEATFVTAKAKDSAPPPSQPVTARILGDEAGEKRESVVAAAPPALLQGAEPVTLSPARVEEAKIDALATTAPPVPALTLIVRADSLVAVRLRAEDLAKSLDGHLDSAAPTNTLLVVLPQSKVNTFRKQIAHAARMRKATAYASAPPPPTASMASGGAVAADKAVEKEVADPMVEVEVIVQPIPKP